MPDWSLFADAARFFQGVPFHILNVLEPINFIERHDYLPLTVSVLRVPWLKRRTVESIIRDHRARGARKNAQDLVDRLRAILGDGFFLLHEARYLQRDCFNVVLGIQTPHECLLARGMGLRLLYWQDYPPLHRWEWDYTYQRVQWDAVIRSGKPLAEIVTNELLGILTDMVSEFQSVAGKKKRSTFERGHRASGIPGKIQDTIQAEPKPKEQRPSDVVPRVESLFSPPSNGKSREVEDEGITTVDPRTGEKLGETTLFSSQEATGPEETAAEEN